SRGSEHDDECDTRNAQRQRDRRRGFGQVADVVGWAPGTSEWGGELLREKVGPVPKPSLTQSCQRVDDLAFRMRSRNGHFIYRPSVARDAARPNLSDPAHETLGLQQ